MCINEQVGVIIPTYNNETIISYCIKSIVEQTYTNIKIILINDGSIDNTAGICDEWEKIDDRIIVIHKENSGPAESRNLGIIKAKRLNINYITFVDGDDVVCNTYIETLMKMIEQTGYKISWVFSREQKFESLRNGISPSKYPNWKKVIKVEANKLLSNEYMRTMYSMCWGKLYHISLFDNIDFPKQYYEDGATLYKLIYKAGMVVYNRSQLYVVVGESSSLTRSKITLTKINDGIKSVFDQKEFYRSNNNIYLEKSSFAGIANDILLWYHKCMLEHQDNVEFDLNEKKKYLYKMLIKHKLDFMNAPNISLINKFIILLCSRNIDRYIGFYFMYKRMYYIKEAIIEKLHKLFKFQI